MVDNNGGYYNRKIDEAIDRIVKDNSGVSTSLPSKQKKEEKKNFTISKIWSEETKKLYFELLTKANAEQERLKSVVEKKKQYEQSRNGLFIINARYGSFEKGKRLLIDTTIPVQFLVNSNASTLFISKETDKNTLPGFANLRSMLSESIDHLELKIIYRFEGSLGMKSFKENEEVVLP
ncbi:hypothetical protein ABK040_003403 [Willaertia magna]